MRWDGKLTSTPEAGVRELQGRTITQGGSSRKAAAPISSEQVPRQRSRSADFISELNRETHDSDLQEVSCDCHDQD